MAYDSQDTYVIRYGHLPAGGCGCSPLFYAFGLLMAALFTAPWWVRALGWIAGSVAVAAAIATAALLFWVLRVGWAALQSARINRQVLRERQNRQTQARTAPGAPVSTAGPSHVTQVRPPQNPLN